MNIYSLFLQLTNAFVWSIWSFETSHYFYMFSLSIVMICLKIQILFFFWARRMGMNKGPESRSLTQSALNQIMRHLVAYFR